MAKNGKELEALLYKNDPVVEDHPECLAAAQEFCEGYKKFLDNAKTEREAAAYSEELLKAAGYRPFVPGMALKAGDKVSLVGFGTFETRKRPERTGRNPRTKETIKIPATVAPAFKAGKALKDAVK